MTASVPLSNAEVKEQLARVNAKIAELRAERRRLVDEIAMIERDAREALIAGMAAVAT